MDSQPGELSSAERQRQTAAELARKRVLASYSYANDSYKKTPVKADVSTTDWQKYHSAWQTYYQKYYSEYYVKAARQYLETEKMKSERQLHDQGETLDSSHQNAAPTANEQAKIELSLREKIRQKATATAKPSRHRQRFIPIFASILVVLTILFMQYNRLIFAPIMAYIAPGNSTDEGITAIDPTVTQAPSAEPRLIVPKLNIDVPINFGLANDEATMMNAMNNGVAHFAIPGASALPGQIGNLLITGHSAGDIYSNNQYKFIFSGLERLQENDNIYVNYNSVRYTYSVTGSKVVEPTDIAALTVNKNQPQIILITCHPLGTSRYRLLIFGEQVNPVPDSNTATQEQPKASPKQTTTMVSNSPTLFESIWKFLTGGQ